MNTNLSLSWDREAAISRVGNDPEIANTLFQTLVDDLDKQILQMDSALSHKDWAGLGQLTHKLLGGCRICATPRLETLLVALEYGIKSQDMRSTKALLADLTHEEAKLRQLTQALE